MDLLYERAELTTTRPHAVVPTAARQHRHRSRFALDEAHHHVPLAQLDGVVGHRVAAALAESHACQLSPNVFIDRSLGTAV